LGVGGMTGLVVWEQPYSGRDQASEPRDWLREPHFEGTGMTIESAYRES
jgi:hypothetical protein